MAIKSIISSDVVTVVRNVTGRVDSSDPEFTDADILTRINQFINYIMPQEVRLYENKTWWEFTITDSSDDDPFPVDLKTLGYTTIGPPAYIDGFDLQWHQDPSVFFSRWPETQTYTLQRPYDVLYYNNELVFRGPPDQDYEVKITAYTVEASIPEGGSFDFNYFWRYVAYGTALDIFSDYGEMDNYAKYLIPFKRYKSLVYARTNQQLMPQRAGPTF